MSAAFLAKLATFHGPRAYAAVFGLLAGSGLMLPINEDVVILASAALTFYGVFRVWALIALIVASLAIADSLIFFWGWRFGDALAARRPFSWFLSPAKLAAAKERFQKSGPGLILATRFLPGVRAPIHFTAGTLKMRWRTFALCDTGAALIEVPALVFAVRLVGGNVARVLPYLKRFQYVALALFALWLADRIRRYWLPAERAPEGPPRSTTPTVN